MSESEQITALGADLDALIERYREEFDLTYAAVVGCLHIKAHLLCMEAIEDVTEDDPE
jgi:hypothetical protein